MKFMIHSAAALGLIATLVLAGCSQATSISGDDSGSAVVGAVTHSIYDFSAASGQTWTGGWSAGPTFDVQNGGTAATFIFPTWEAFKGPTLATALDASGYSTFSVAIKGTWTGDTIRISLYDSAESQAEFDIAPQTLGLSSTKFKAATFATSAAGFEAASGSEATAFDWTSVKYVKIYSMGGNGTLVVSNLGFK